MRLVKLSTVEFENIADVNDYFAVQLPARTPPGQFRIPKGWIAQDGLNRGDVLLFSFNSRVVRVARSASGRLQNSDEYQVDYPHYFVVDLKTVRQVDFSVVDLEGEMQQMCGVTKSIAVAQGWVRLPDTSVAIQAIERLGQLAGL